MTTRIKDCDDAIVRGRLRKAEQFLAAAATLMRSGWGATFARSCR
jgi:hypothetical protein